MAAIHVTEKDFEEVVLKSEKKVLVDFWATWCGPCQMIGPIIEELSEQREDVLVCKVNVDEQPGLAMKYNVMSIPTLLVIENGETIKRSLGAIPKSEIEALLA